LLLTSINYFGYNFLEQKLKLNMHHVKLFL
jgi:hypothetical protein